MPSCSSARCSAIDQLEAKLAAAEAARREPIAIVGMGLSRAGRRERSRILLEAAAERCRRGHRSAGGPLGHRALFRPGPGCSRQDVQRAGVRSCATLISSMLRSSAFPDVKRRTSIRSSVCCWNVPGRRWSTAGISPASLMGTQAAVFVGISTHDYSPAGEQYRPGPHGRCVHRQPERRTASLPDASRTCSG